MDVFVVSVNSIETQDVVVQGDAALAIVSAGDVIINGVVELSASLDTPGPGALLGDSNCVGKDSEIVVGRASGAGGGGFGGAGGAGGDTVILSSNGGDGGEVSGNPELTPLRGGCRGGFGNGGPNEEPTVPDAGAGGGALQVVSNVRIALLGEAAIRANGGGAKSRTAAFPGFCVVTDPPFPCSPAYGGGSGGAVLLEAPEVVLPAQASIVANGGAGHCGANGFAPGGGNGTTPAAGTVCTGLEGDGGNGGAGETAATPGGSVFDERGVGGGGGGGVGRIRVNVAAGTDFVASGTVSPPHTHGDLGLR